uniref:Tumor necrosis factor receptor superfamily member 17-like n=1 Tax=Cyprinus carpio TaxID=7962 RepID=A0A8C2EG90_CYPCA
IERMINSGLNIAFSNRLFSPQCQIRFGGRKEIASDSDSRVICLCAQFEAVLQHGLRKSRGLALTAAAIKHAAGFTSKTEAELTFWFYVKEHLNRHELQRFYSLRNITSEQGRGRAWLRCALNEHSLERYLHMLLADHARLSAFYEDWAFVLDEERASMLPTMAAGLNSILFAINIDNTDLNGQARGGSSVSHLLKESTQGMSSLWKESTQGVSTLLREIGTATAVVPGFIPRSDAPSDPLPVLPRSFGTLVTSIFFFFLAELRQAIVAMMNRKDELTEQNTSLRSLLDGEMEHSAGLRQEVDSLKKRLTELEERHAAKVQALMRENEVLKVQLKKYVGAVQMLKREGSQGNDALTIQRNCDGPPPAPQNRSVADIEELAASYERKLIEVAEMHGELIEFNERLYRSLMAKDNLIGQMRQELIDLRGPVPGDLSQTSDDPSLSDFETESLLRIKSMVYIRILDNEWNVYRRYAEFRALHNYLRPQFPQVDTFNFPPKKAIGNKDAKFVEERRKQLQSYLRMVMNKLIQALPEFTAQPTKETLLQLLPFCQDNPTANESGAKTARSKASSRFPRLGRNSGREARNPEPQSGDL